MSQNNKENFKKFAEDMINSMNIDEIQKTVMVNMFENTVDSMTNDNLKEIEEKVKEYVNKSEDDKNIFD